ncbi:MAG: hypothetical protein CL916_02325 [Deltaproteobacteria bacterium]|nr:hypothetical protein [Deltaproteobacteria bacterium]
MYSHRYCSPIWKRQGDYFVPKEWSKIRYPHRVRNIIDEIKNHLTDKDTPVFVRGSLIEEKNPHPKSDLDIIIFQHHHTQDVISPKIHQSFQRLVDINLFDANALEPRTILLPLIHLRSIQISGTTFVQRPIPINTQFWEPLWGCYAIGRLKNNIHALPPRKVMELKQLIRAVGVLYLRHRGDFSRDIETCLGWLETYDKELGVYTRQIWSKRSSLEVLDVAPIRHWLLEFWDDLESCL